MPNWVEATNLDDLAPGSALEWTHEGRVYALFRSGDRLDCIDGLCPHQGGRLAFGTVVGPSVICPRRGCLRWRFDLETGECPVGESLRRTTYPVRVEGRTILVGLPGG